MATKLTPTEEPAVTVRLYPTADAYIPGVPAVVTDCDPVTAEVLLAYSPPAFTTEPPAEPAQPTED
jgi:hypothetical protein